MWNYTQVQRWVDTEDNWKQVSRELHLLLGQCVPDGSTAKQYIKADMERDGFRVWRRVTGRLDSRRVSDETFEWHRLIEHPEGQVYRLGYGQYQEMGE